MTRAVAIIGFSVLMTLALGPAAGAAPKSNANKEVFTILAEDLEAILEFECGVDLTVTGSGWVQVKVFPGTNNQLELDVFHIDFTATNSDGVRHRILDVGPDHYYFDKDGNLILTITGRSLTGSGWIGHVVINLDTGEVLLEAGNLQGDWIANACAALT